MRESRHWKSAIFYCRYADDFVIVVKGARAHAEVIREACKEFLEGELKLTLNMEKTHNTCERRLRLPWSPCYPQGWTTWPHAACDDNSWEKYRGFEGRLVKPLSGNYSMNRMDLVENLNRQLAGWAAFYQYTDYTATLFGRLDRTVFWKLGYWPAPKYRRGFSVADARPYPRTGAEAQTKTWVLQGQNSRG